MRKHFWRRAAVEEISRTKQYSSSSSFRPAIPRACVHITMVKQKRVERRINKRSGKSNSQYSRGGISGETIMQTRPRWWLRAGAGDTGVEKQRESPFRKRTRLFRGNIWRREEKPEGFPRESELSRVKRSGGKNARENLRARVNAWGERESDVNEILRCRVCLIWLILARNMEVVPAKGGKLRQQFRFSSRRPWNFIRFRLFGRKIHARLYYDVLCSWEIVELVTIIANVKWNTIRNRVVWFFLIYFLNESKLPELIELSTLLIKFNTQYFFNTFIYTYVE